MWEAYILEEKNKALVTAVTSRDVVAVIGSLVDGADIHYRQDFPLRSAAYLGYTDMVELLLDNNANIHVNGDEPLFVAIKARDQAMFDMLVARGASLQTVLDTKKDKLDKESMAFINEIKLRDINAISEKRAAALNKKKISIRPS